MRYVLREWTIRLLSKNRSYYLRLRTESLRHRTSCITDREFNHRLRWICTQHLIRLDDLRRACTIHYRNIAHMAFQRRRRMYELFSFCDPIIYLTLIVQVLVRAIIRCKARLCHIVLYASLGLHLFWIGKFLFRYNLQLLS